MSDDGNDDGLEAGDEGRYVVRCRGLPWSTTVDEIKNFFSNCRFKEGKNLVFPDHILKSMICLHT